MPTDAYRLALYRWLERCDVRNNGHALAAPSRNVRYKDLPTEVEADSAHSLVRVSAGLSYAALAVHLDRQGFALRNLASLPHISVAGACATGTHGSGTGNQNLSAAVAGLDPGTVPGGDGAERERQQSDSQQHASDDANAARSVGRRRGQPWTTRN